ncbi:MAG TPA: GNAT family N-acetyltransferase [Bryobacteraceae bacterium]|nr:GNAT family N-acetyltransferase [Bryobacteraceae bacterium]
MLTDNALPTELTIRQPAPSDLDRLAPLFDGYRRFYRQPSDMEGAKRFLLDRLRYNQSVIFIAFQGNEAVGFTQLYPSFSSGAMAQIFILNDLFVAPNVRKRGIGGALLERAAEYARQLGALRMVLSTEAYNLIAQSLYQKHGWKRDAVFQVYALTL